MATVFTDEAGTYDLTITTSADWTVSSGGLPNSDNYVYGDGSIALTYNTNGDDFHIADGTNWSIEFWWQITADSSAAEIIMDRTKPTVAVVSDIAWRLVRQDDQRVTLAIFNTANGTFQSVDIPSLISPNNYTNEWFYICFVRTSGGTLTGYHRRVGQAESSVAGSSTTGTATNPTGTYLVFGTEAGTNNDLTSTARIAKFAIYNKALSADERNDHYLAMAAS